MSVNLSGGNLLSEHCSLNTVRNRLLGNAQRTTGRRVKAFQFETFKSASEQLRDLDESHESDVVRQAPVYRSTCPQVIRPGATC